MKESWKYFAKRAIYRTLVEVDVTEKHFFLFATRRGGSTLARDLLYTLPGFDVLCHP